MFFDFEPRIAVDRGDRHKYLGTNLQYCSDLGRRAFNEAQAGMSKLQGRADLVIGKMGAVSATHSVQGIDGLARPSHCSLII